MQIPSEETCVFSFDSSCSQWTAALLSWSDACIDNLEFIQIKISFSALSSQIFSSIWGLIEKII